MFRTADRHALAALRERIARIERGDNRADGRVAPVGPAAIDSCLADGGLAFGTLHEAMGGGPDTEHAAAATLFLASILARQDGPVLWVLRRLDLFAPGLAGVGLRAERLLFVEAGKDVLAAAEEGLRHPGLTAVVAEVEGRLALVASRRLRLAAEQSGVLGLLVRRSLAFDDPVLLEPSAATTRWRVTRPPSAPAGFLGRGHWRLDLLRDRDGKSSSWIVEEADATGRLSLVATAADRPDQAIRRRA